MLMKSVARKRDDSNILNNFHFQKVGVTLFADPDKVKLFEKVEINYQESLAGGGFYITGETIDVCACGNCFSLK